MKRAIAATGVALLGVAHAGHEFPFYPSFYPQEITVEALDAATAARRFGEGTLHAYAGGAVPESDKTAAVSSLGGYVVAVSEPGACVDARGMNQALAPGQVWHPYPVTPFHADYLHHADRVEAAGVAQGEAAAKVELVELREWAQREHAQEPRSVVVADVARELDLGSEHAPIRTGNRINFFRRSRCCPR